jgi:hypothetical protein
VFGLRAELVGRERIQAASGSSGPISITRLVPRGLARGIYGAPHLTHNLRDAIAFFDEIGWQTPLRLREAKAG